MKQDNLPQRIYSWGLCGCFAFAVIIALVSLQSGHTLMNTVINMLVAFFVMYLLLEVSFTLFSKFSDNVDLDYNDAAYTPGTHIDVSLNDAELDESVELAPAAYKKTSTADVTIPGQLQPSLSQEMPDSELRQQIKQRMGLEN